MMISRRHLLSLALLLGALPPAATGAEWPRPRPRAAAPEVWARTELYFGTNRPGGEVTQAEFDLFVNEHVTRLFPDGMTLLTGYGQFKTSSGELIRERSYVLILLYPPQLRDANSRIQELRETYKRLHGQESVLRVDGLAFVSF